MKVASEMPRRSPTDDLRELRFVFSPDSGFTGPERSVLAALILRRNGESGRCDPSLSRIAEEAGVSRSTVVRALDSLDASNGGPVRRSRAKDGRTRTSYSLRLPTRPTVTLVPERDQTQGGTGVVPQWDGGSPMVTPERTKRTNEGTSDTPPEGAEPDIGEAVEVESVKKSDASDGMKANELVGAWISRQPARPPNAAVGKQGAAAKRLVKDYSRSDLEGALDGIGRLFPYSNGTPWDLFTLEKKMATAVNAPATNGRGGLPSEVDHDDLEQWRQKS